MTDLAALLGKLDLDEKIAQLQGMLLTDLYDLSEEGMKAAMTGGGAVFDLDKMARLRPHGVGHLSLAWFHRADEAGFRRALADIQDRARQTSRFGIGVLIHGEGINGLVHGTGIQFPTSWAQAATWSPELVERCATVTSAQLRSYGIALCFSPVLDLARDPRWGRVHETYGEDPELVSQLGVGFVRGMNGRDGDSGVTATGKHFLGYGSSEGGLNQARTSLGRRALVDEYAEPFRRVIAEAGLSVVMNSYNDVDGVPAAANRWLLTELLREQLGFDGLVVSDYDAVKMLRTVFHTARDEAEAAAQALTAGLDVELPGPEMFSHLRHALETGLVTEEDVDRAALRVLRAKQDAGLVPDLAPRRAPRPHVEPDRDAARELGRQVAVDAVTLLQNDGVLPLAPGTRVAVVGSLADELRIHFGAYTDVANEEQPLAINMVRSGQVEGIDPATFIFTDIFQVRIPGIGARFEEVARTLHAEVPTLLGALRATGGVEVDFVDVGSPDSTDPIDTGALSAAVAGADVVVAVLGERTGWVGNNHAGEGQTTARLDLPGNQHELVAALAQLDTPLVSVLVGGRPLVVTDVAEASAAVLLAPLLGQQAPAAIADALIGAVEPGGRLPSTWPRHVGQVPLHHGHPFGSGYGHPTGTRHGYNDLDASPLYPFGHGLGYTTIEVELAGAELDGGAIHVRARARNRGDRAGSTVVQVYARDEHASVVAPVRRLVGFARARLDVGGSAELAFDVPLERMHYTMTDGRRGVEAGEVTVLVGTSSADITGHTTISVPEHVAG